MSQLTAVQVRNAKPKNKPYKIPDGYGMYLHVSKSGKKTWRYRYRIAGTESTFVLGEYPQMSLESARAKRMAARELVKNGINPAKQRKEETKSNLRKSEAAENSFQKISFEWAEKQSERWSRSHAKAVHRSLVQNAFPYIGSLPLNEITPPMLLQMLQQMEKRGALELARKVSQRVNSVFVYAIRTGQATINPAASMQGAIKSRKVAHHPALSKAELPYFFRDLEKAKIHISSKLGLKFLILTAARSAEVRDAQWHEIDIENELWRIPAERMKMDCPHVVPLSKQSLAILEQIGKIFGKSGYIFPSVRDLDKPMSQNTMLYAMHRMGYQERATVHGFRATFSTIANESGFDGDVIEKALAHVERNRVRAAYHRSEYLEQRRELLQWWGTFLYDISDDNIES